MKQVKLFFVLFTTYHLFFSSVQANESKTIQLTMSAFEEVEVINQQGKTVLQLIEPSNMVPGDTVVYLTKYHNTTNQIINNVVITNPIPKHLVYTSHTAKQNQTVVTYSIDSGETFKTTDKLIIQTTNNEQRPASPKDYTHVRWTIDSVAIHGKGSVRFSAKLK